MSHKYVGRDKMKKITCSFLAIILGCGGALGATTPWWERETICRLNGTNCYGDETNGIATYVYDDSTIGCWGRKIICPGVLSDHAYFDNNEGVPLDIIINYTKPDFDTNIYVPSGQCWGARRSIQNGTMVLVDGSYVPVWCPGVLDSVHETLPNGEINLRTQPTCEELARNNYAKILNGLCYGKWYDPARFAVQCNGETSTLVILNGADYNRNSTRGLTPSSADSTFDNLRRSSETQRNKYFK